MNGIAPEGGTGSDPAAPLRIALVWDQLTDYHLDRCEALALQPGVTVRAVGIAGSSRKNAWGAPSPRPAVPTTVLFPDRRFEDVPFLAAGARLLREIRRFDPAAVFLANYARPATILAASTSRIEGRRTILMTDSKWDDRERSITGEAAKRALNAVFHGALVSGEASRQYLRWLGFRRRPVATGCDAVSTARLRTQAGAAGPRGDTDGTPHEERHFMIVSRLVPKKRVDVGLRAYRRYAAEQERHGVRPRPLLVAGVGPLEAELRDEARDLSDAGLVTFLGQLSQPELVGHLASSLALVLPSTGEQWGLVVNEALALGAPVLCTAQCGAAELVISGINGYALPEHELEGAIAFHLGSLANDAAMWQRLSAGALRHAGHGDVGRFVQAALELARG
jgi:L-malate glycosyltransferase